MIQIHIKKSEHGNIIGFHVSGHAGFSPHGTDVVCAGVFALVINCINSVEQFTDTRFDLSQNESAGVIDFTCKTPVDDKAMLLIRSMIFGIREIENTYGNEYVALHE